MTINPVDVDSDCRNASGKRLFRGFIRVALLLLTIMLAGSASEAQMPAFPGAVGQGIDATGGRGGDVYHVTNLDDYNPRTNESKIVGSLRHAIRSADGPRTIVFEVSGLIRLEAALEIHKSQLTIAGQTSPAGITLYGYPLELSKCEDVIVRHLRVRCGDTKVGEDRHVALHPASANAVNVGPSCDRVILDHVSASWSIDETFSVTRSRNVTVQYCLISQSLNDSLHPKGPHGYGSLVRGQLTSADQAAATGGYTFFANLWAHHRARNPSVAGEQHWEDQTVERGAADVNLANNVIYNWGDSPAHRSQGGDVRINLVANYFINGPENGNAYVFRESEQGITRLFHTGNVADHDQDQQHDGTLVTKESTSEFRSFDDRDELLTGSNPFGFLGSVEGASMEAEVAYEMVLEQAGASLWRDAIDQAVIDSVRERSGALIDSQEELRRTDGTLEGIDDLPAERRPADFDSDKDGMPDEFERSHDLDPTNPADRNLSTLSDQGYTNLEVYLNGLAK